MTNIHRLRLINSWQSRRSIPLCIRFLGAWRTGCMRPDGIAASCLPAMERTSSILARGPTCGVQRTPLPLGTAPLLHTRPIGHHHHHHHHSHGRRRSRARRIMLDHHPQPEIALGEGLWRVTATRLPTSPRTERSSSWSRHRT